MLNLVPFSGIWGNICNPKMSSVSFLKLWKTIFEQWNFPGSWILNELGNYMSLSLQRKPHDNFKSSYVSMKQQNKFRPALITRLTSPVRCQPCLQNPSHKPQHSGCLTEGCGNGGYGSQRHQSKQKVLRGLFIWQRPLKIDVQIQLISIVLRRDGRHINTSTALKRISVTSN